MKAIAGRAARRLTWPVLLLAAVAMLAGFGVFPTRTYLDKREAVAAAETRLQQLTEANDAAQGRVDQLGSDAEIERLARDEYGMVKAGEEAYRVTPEARDPVQIPDVWPFNRLHQRIG